MKWRTGIETSFNLTGGLVCTCKCQSGWRCRFIFMWCW